MSTADLINLLFGGGVLAHGVGVLRWAVRMETRVTALEVKGGAA